MAAAGSSAATMPGLSLVGLSLVGLSLVRVLPGGRPSGRSIGAARPVVGPRAGPTPAPETRNRAAEPRPGRAIGAQPPRCVRKQSEQYTGLPLVGRNGTLASRPQLEHVAVNISRGALLRLP